MLLHALTPTSCGDVESDITPKQMRQEATRSKTTDTYERRNDLRFHFSNRLQKDFSALSISAPCSPR
jgi:hypothetical protein